MSKLDSLKEGLSQEAFMKEPLARAIIMYLKKENPSAYTDIINIFDHLMEVEFNRIIEDYDLDDELKYK